MARTVLMAAIVCVLLVLSQVLLKLSLRTTGTDSKPLFALVSLLLPSPVFWLAVLSTGVAAVLWMSLLRCTPVSVLYPLVSVSYLLMVPAARIVFGEPITLSKTAGAAIICLGVYVLSWSAPLSAQSSLPGSG